MGFIPVDGVRLKRTDNAPSANVRTHFWGIEYTEGETRVAQEIWPTEKQAKHALWVLRTFHRAQGWKPPKGKIVRLWVVDND